MGESTAIVNCSRMERKRRDKQVGLMILRHCPSVILRRQSPRQRQWDTHSCHCSFREGTEAWFTGRSVFRLQVTGLREFVSYIAQESHCHKDQKCLENAKVDVIVEKRELLRRSPTRCRSGNRPKETHPSPPPPPSISHPELTTWTYQMPTVNVDRRLCHLPSIHANATSFLTSSLCCIPCGNPSPSTFGISVKIFLNANPTISLPDLAAPVAGCNTSGRSLQTFQYSRLVLKGTHSTSAKACATATHMSTDRIAYPSSSHWLSALHPATSGT